MGGKARPEVEAELERLVKGSGATHFVPIETAKIIIGHWVRLRCQLYP